MVKYGALKCLYDVEKTIGTGGFAKVKLGTHLLTGERVAIKIMNKACLGDGYHRVKMELAALKSICHHHICKLYQVIETKEHFFMIMEYCSGGELFDHIVEKSKLTEFEARLFFRQILSSVAYLHSMGYAHRDLKPENILLDKDVNLKLIDFGLCAKPQGGMASHLQTSCGSPTYAAPELIKGQQYLGDKVDVWSLGVLLFALLSGFLPFDCDNIETLYKKILSGKYNEPSWLSNESKKIIGEMLQVDPNHRISISELLSHPWVTMEYFEPVRLDTLHKYHERVEPALEVMAELYGGTREEVWRRLGRWEYDYDTATYLLLVTKHRQGLPLRVNPPSWPRPRLLRAKKVPCPLLPPAAEADNLPVSPPTRQTYTLLKEALNNNELSSIESLNEKNTPHGLQTPQKTSRKRGHATGSEDIDSPIPSKMTPCRTRRTSTPSSDSPRTPVASTPGAKLLCSIERKINRVRNVLTPKKRNATQNTNPSVLTARRLCNVSTTCFTDPDVALEELKAALAEAGIVCETKGFTLRGKIVETKQSDSKSCKLSFELEVCMVQSRENQGPAVVGIKRKRLKGDSWCYKKVCEQILKMTKTNKNLEPHPSLLYLS